LEKRARAIWRRKKEEEKFGAKVKKESL